MEDLTILQSDRLDPTAVHERVMAAYEAVGYPRHIVASWAISENDIEDFVRLAVEADPRKILEVGTFVGVSTMLLALVCPKARIFTVDPGLPLSVEMSSTGSNMGGVDYDATTTDIARKVAKKLGVLNRIQFVTGGFAVGDTFSSVLSKGGAKIDVVGPKLCREEGPFDFAFIDGLHSAEAVEADLVLTATALTQDAVMVLHDCVGFWGANVRGGVFEFLRTRPDYFFSHPRYSHIYKSVGVLRPRGDGRSIPGLVRKPFAAGDVSPLLIQALARLTDTMAGKRPVVEIGFGGALLSEAYAEESFYSWLHFDEPKRDAQSPDLERLSTAFAARLGETKSAAVFSADLLDFASPQLLASIVEIALRRDAPLVLTSTPPGEEGVAGPHSRPIAAIIDLVEKCGGAVYAQPALDLESERYALLHEPRQLGETSLFASFIVIAGPGGFADARGRNLVRLSPGAGAEREQLELQRTHLTAGYRRYYNERNELGLSSSKAGERVLFLEGEVRRVQQQVYDAQAGLQAEVQRHAAIEAEVHGFAVRFAEVAASLAQLESRRMEIEARHAEVLQELESERALVQHAEAQHATQIADIEARHLACLQAVEDERARLAVELDHLRGRHEALLRVAIDVFEAMDALDAGLEEQTKALGFKDAPLAERARDQEGLDLLDADQVVAQLGAMRSNGRWVARRTLEVIASLERLQSDHEALRAENFGLREAVRELRSSTSWRLMAPFRLLGSAPRRLPKLPSYLKRLVRARIEGRRLVALQAQLNRELAPTGKDALVFDAEWYARVYGDVPPGHALKHYLMFGEGEGRKPHPNFDPNFYRSLYPDVAASNTSPLVHFMQFGLKEGRSPTPALHPLEDLARAADLPPLVYYAEA